MTSDLPTIPDLPPTATGPGPGASVVPPTTATDGPAAAANETPAVEKPPYDGPPPDETAMIEALKELIDPELKINIIAGGHDYSISHD
jgi:hypothetical protein